MADLMMDIALRMCTPPDCPKCRQQMRFETGIEDFYKGRLRLVCKCGHASGWHVYELYNTSFPALWNVIRETSADKGRVHDPVCDTAPANG